MTCHEGTAERRSIVLLISDFRRDLNIYNRV